MISLENFLRFKTSADMILEYTERTICNIPVNIKINIMGYLVMIYKELAIAKANTEDKLAIDRAIVKIRWMAECVFAACGTCKDFVSFEDAKTLWVDLVTKKLVNTKYHRLMSDLPVMEIKESEDWYNNPSLVNPVLKVKTSYFTGRKEVKEDGKTKRQTAKFVRNINGSHCAMKYHDRAKLERSEVKKHILATLIGDGYVFEHPETGRVVRVDSIDGIYSKLHCDNGNVSGLMSMPKSAVARGMLEEIMKESKIIKLTKRMAETLTKEDNSNELVRLNDNSSNSSSNNNLRSSDGNEHAFGNRNGSSDLSNGQSCAVAVEEYAVDTNEATSMVSEEEISSEVESRIEDTVESSGVRAEETSVVVEESSTPETEEVGDSSSPVAEEPSLAETLIFKYMDTEYDFWWHCRHVFQRANNEHFNLTRKLLERDGLYSFNLLDEMMGLVRECLESSDVPEIPPKQKEVA